MSENNGEQDFIIKDRRFFGQKDDVQKETHEDNTTTEKKIKQEKKASEQKETKESRNKEEKIPFPSIDFSNFILSLHTSALFHFGDLHDPSYGENEKNLPAAKQTIDILDMLQKKTEGNLDNNERNLLEGILYELRMRYVKESGKQ